MIDFSAIDGVSYCAPGFRGVRTIVKSAISCGIDDVGKHLLECVLRIPQTNRTHAGSIDENPTTWQYQQVASDRGVATLGITRPNFLCVLDLLAEQRVDKRRLSGPRFAEKRA